MMTRSARDPPQQDRQQTTVSVNFDESPDRARQQLNFEVSECIETTTTTTTTTTKRCYPPLFVGDSRPLRSLDAKEYPLSQKPTPPEMAKFSFDIGQESGAGSPIRWSGSSFSDYQDGRGDEVAYLAQTQTDSGDESQLMQSPSRRANSQDPAVKREADAETPCSRGLMFKNRRALAQRSGDQRSGESSSSSLRPQHQSQTGRSSKRNSSKSRPVPQGLSYAVQDSLRRNTVAQSSREAKKGNIPSPSTPDTLEPASQHDGPSQRLRLRKPKRSHLDSFETPDSDPRNESQQPFFESLSPSNSDSNTVFSASSVATPPITDADAEPFADPDESLQQSIRALNQTRPANSVAGQDASLPSPRLSPTLQATQLHQPVDGDEPASEELSVVLHGDSQNSLDEQSRSFSTALARTPSKSGSGYELVLNGSHPGLMDSRSMLESFDAMPSEMQSFMMYQLLRRCPRKTLHFVAGVVNPALKCDILKDLPLELTLHVLSYLDHRDLCRAAQVSKHWRSTIDSNETGWKELLDRDGFKLPPGEVERAIREGWGWQDPVGAEGCERDFSLQSRLTSTETELVRSSSSSSSLRPDPPAQKLRPKRKRTLNNFGSERTKRRASTFDNVKDERTYTGEKLYKLEGPMSAASTAAVAVPDPKLGLPSLRRLHLFKSLYRRHYMIRQSWTSGKVQPSHVAFAAHPRHVITCLQFDEDKIITGSDDMFIHIYDTKTGKLRKKLEGHEGGVWALQYQGNVLVSGSTDRSVRVWDIEKGLCTQVFYGHTSTVRCLEILMPAPTGAVDDEGKAVMMPAKPLIITGSRDSQLRVWRLPESGSRRYIQTGPPANDADCPYFIRTLQGHTHSVRAIAAHADTLVSGSYDNTVRVWRISTGETVHVLQGHTQKVYSVVLDTARNRCISGSMDSFVKIWDLETGSCTHTLEGHSLLVGLLDLRDDRLVSAAADSTLRIWDPENGRCHSALTAHTGAITCFQHDGRKVISGSDRSLKMWDIKTGACLQDLLTDLGGVWQVRFDERRCIAAVQRDGLTYIEILDFGAVRDGKTPESLGKRTLLNPNEVQRMIEEDQNHNNNNNNNNGNNNNANNNTNNNNNN